MIIFILIPSACAGDIDDSSDNLEVADIDNDLAVDDSTDLSQDKESIVLQDELLDNSDDGSDEGLDDGSESGEELDEESEESYDEYDFSPTTGSWNNYDDKTILCPYHSMPGSSIDIAAYFTDNLGEPLKNTEVIFRINETDYRVKTDSNGLAFLTLEYLYGKFNITLFNPVTGENYSFPEFSNEKLGDPFFTTGFRHNGNTHMFTLNSNGVKSTIKNDEGIVSKAITYSKDKVIISTKTNDSSEKIVVDKFTRYMIYLIAILCIVVPIGILRYRKKNS